MESPRIAGEENRRGYPLWPLTFLLALDLIEKITSYMVSMNLISYLMSVQFQDLKQATLLTNALGGVTALSLAFGAGIAHAFKGR
ncbi:hypothetical protein ACS0TY_030729 [Phlomoides rotata]